MACALRPRPRHQELSTLAAATHTSPTPRCPSQLDRDGGTLLALVTPALVQETFAVLAQPEGDVQSLKRYEDFLWRCLRTALPHLIEDLDSGSFERPDGVCEEVWGALVGTHMLPALKTASYTSTLARMELKVQKDLRDVEGKLKDTLQPEIRGVMSALEEAKVDPDIITVVSYSFAMAMRRVGFPLPVRKVATCVYCV